MNSRWMRALRAIVVACVALVTAVPASAGERANAWPERVLDLAGGIAVQDGGRVKPLSTYASFTLLRLSGKRSLTTRDGATLDATAWLLDVFFHPAEAEREPLFLVADSDAIEALGISIEGRKKRDRWSRAELEPGVSKLLAIAHQYDAIEPKLRSSLQQQVVTLAENVHAFDGLLGAFEWARRDLPVAAKGSNASAARVQTILGGTSPVRVSTALAHAGELAALHGELSTSNDPAAIAELEPLYALERAADEATRGSQSLRILPPAVGVAAREEWLSAWSVLADAFGSGAIDSRHVEALRAWETVARTDDRSAPELAIALGMASEVHASLVLARGEGAKLALERAYYRWSPLGWSQALFGLAFMAAALLWLRPTSSMLHRTVFALVAAAAAALVAAIALRCAIRGRPPVSTLYETVLFVTAVGTVVALVLEAINRRRIAVSAAALLGLAGLFVANGYETLDKQDTMPSLVAVLDTNFWLATHVTAITVGYASGMLAALLASVYLLARVLRWRRNDPVFFRELARMVYGVTCFGAIFAIVGTILGGIWANESWGRFWGWDPKENGALLIVIAQVAILHARLAGWLREFGLCLAVAFGGTVIAFSWWGVNVLGVGLHSYGFTSGIQTALWGYYAVQWGLCVAAGVVAWRARGLAREARGVVRGG